MTITPEPISRPPQVALQVIPQVTPQVEELLKAFEGQDGRAELQQCDFIKSIGDSAGIAEVIVTS